MKTFSFLWVGLLAAVAAAEVSGQVREETVSGIEDALERYAVVLPIFAQEGTGFFHAEAKVNGHPILMMVDSGAQGIILDHRVGETAGLELRQEGKAAGADGQRLEASVGTVGDFSVGPVTLRNQTMTFVDLANLGEIKVGGTTRQRGGQLGAGFLRASSALVDFGRGRVAVPKAKIQGGLASVYEQAGYHIETLVPDGSRLYCQALVSGKPVLFLCDTGTNLMTLRADYVGALGLEVTEQAGTLKTIGEKQTAQRVTWLAEFSVGPLKLPNAAFLVLDDTKPLKQIGGLPVVGLMGTNFFRPARAAIDFGSGRMALAVKPGE